MKVITVQYSAMYTLFREGEHFIRQFNKYSDPDAEDEIVWYRAQQSGFAEVIADPELIQLLDEEFEAIIE